MRGRAEFLVRLMVLAVAAGAMFLLSACTTVDAVTKKNVYNIYSVQEDVELGQSAMKQNLAEMEKQKVRINGDAARLEQLRTMMRRITAVSDMPNLPYEVTLIQNNVVNAAAMPGGQMMVFNGLYDPQKGLTRDDDEMAAVMAHEIAHVNCRHTTERLSKLMTASAITELAAVAIESGNQGELAAALRAVFSVGATLWIPTYTRADEYEADRVGLFYMAKAGYDPRAAARIWQRAGEGEKKSGKGTPGGLSLLATHPGSSDRFRTLNAMMPHAMEEYARATGRYPPDYKSPAGNPPPQPYNWRIPAGK